MDLKLKSIACVGRNISQKFETMCQQVDNIVSEDTVKYVENQMQTMGASVKRFCSDVVQDFLPPSVDHGRHEAQEVVPKRDDFIDTCIKSVTGTEENSADTLIKQSQEEPNPVDHLKNQLGHAVSGLYLENQLITPVSGDPVDETESDLVSGKAVDVLAHESSDKDIEEHAIKDKSSTSEVLELMSLGEMNLSEVSLSSDSSESNDKNAHGVVVEMAHANSVDVMECQPTQIVDAVSYKFADDSVSVTDSSNTFAASEMAFSDAFCKENILETILIPSSDPRLMESKNLRDCLTAETIICTDAVDKVGCVYDSYEAIPSSTSSPIVSHEDNKAEVEHINSSSVLSLESSEEEASRTNYTTSLSGMSQKTNCEFCGTAQSEASAISPDNGHSHDYGDDLDYSGMETIELCDNMELEDSCILVDNNALYAVSYRTRKLMSFKKRIQEAFVPKKRLAKEYEQLAIWFGDAYMGPEQDTLQNLLPATSSATLESENSPTRHICDSEWELL
ncbi:hypothetical protein AB3S75_017108 [Citrus x aurantiifolia]